KFSFIDAFSHLSLSSVINYPVEPGRKFTFNFKGMQIFKCLNKCILCNVLSLFFVLTNPKCDSHRHLLIGIHKITKGGGISAEYLIDALFFVHHSYSNLWF